jgi:hypothetical protein
VQTDEQYVVMFDMLTRRRNMVKVRIHNLQWGNERPISTPIEPPIIHSKTYQPYYVPYSHGEWEEKNNVPEGSDAATKLEYRRSVSGSSGSNLLNKRVLLWHTRRRM